MSAADELRLAAVELRIAADALRFAADKLRGDVYVTNVQPLPPLTDEQVKAFRAALRTEAKREGYES